MTRWLPHRLALALAFLAQQPALHAQTVPVRGETLIEAEDGVTPDSPWKKIALDPDAKQFYVAPLNVSQRNTVDNSSAPELSYTVELDHQANYAIWVKAYAPDLLTANSFFAALDGQNYSAQYIPKAGEWVWLKLGQSGTLPAGRHTLQIKYRRSNVRLDRLLFTSLSAYQPGATDAAPTVDNAIPLPPNIPAPPVFPPAGVHPRLFLSSAEQIQGIKTLRDRVGKMNLPASLPANPELREYWALNKAWSRLFAAADLTEATFPTMKDKDGKDVPDCATAVKSVQANALLYLVEDDAARGEKALRLATVYLNHPVCYAGASNARTQGNALLLSAIVYDWCAKLLVNRKALRDLLVLRYLEQAQRMEIGFPPLKQNQFTSHGSEAQLLRDQLSGGIAFYDEVPNIYRITAGRFFHKYIEPRRTLYQAGGHHQGDSYGAVRYMWDVFTEWMYRRMGRGPVFEADQQNLPQQWLYMRRPDGQLMRDGDSFIGSYTGLRGYWAAPPAFMLPGALYRNATLRGEFRRQLAGWEVADDLWLVLFNDPDLAAKSSLEDLPLSYYASAPIGMMIARTGWTKDNAVQLDSPVAVATMKLGLTHFGNHQHLDAGHFQLYYKGGLAIDSGIYSGVDDKHEYNSPHDRNYHKRTVAHNAMLVMDKSEVIIPGYANDGGQRHLDEPGSDEDMAQRIVSTELHRQIGGGTEAASRPDYSYLKGNLSQAYSAKVRDYTRAFVFLNLKDNAHPAALLVHDRIAASHPSFDKTWLLHSVGKPEVSEHTVTTITRTDNGYNGKLVNHTLLPSDRSIAIVGGKDLEYAVFDPVSETYVNYPQAPNRANNSEEGGSYRIELRPKYEREQDSFLNIMQVLDASGPASTPLATAALGGENDALVGAKIADRAVLFANSTEDLASSASFTLPAFSGELKVLITALAPGNWSVVAEDGTFRFDGPVSAQEGTLYFSVKNGGRYTLRPLATAP
ncbi:heparinase II/III family protein [Massilia sp. NR 4-1]|uniref:heparinase II/III domain-containing protein n=1 Tax=Massilia sp. NR 4-1 TaxID=1678028 RepID=UPI0009E2C9E3|nr:heparinase II/III family protein [Massilia sp. NR 4-1]